MWMNAKMVNIRTQLKIRMWRVIRKKNPEKNKHILEKFYVISLFLSKTNPELQRHLMVSEMWRI